MKGNNYQRTNTVIAMCTLQLCNICVLLNVYIKRKRHKRLARKKNMSLNIEFIQMKKHIFYTDM